MISIYQLKPAFQNLLRPISHAWVRWGVTPNTVTVCTCVLSVVVAAGLYATPNHIVWAWALPVFMFVRMALNAVDGMMAKEHQMQSPLGCLLNEITDVIADAALLLALASWTHVSPPLLVFTVLLAITTEITGMSAVQIGVSRRYDGPMGKSDRAFAFSVITILLALDLLPGQAVNVLLSVISGLMVLTCYNRVVRALKEKEVQDIQMGG